MRGISTHPADARVAAIGRDAIIVLGRDGRVVRTESPTSGREGRAVLARLPDIGPGEYRVRWRVTGTDGDLVESELGFFVGAVPTGLSAAPAGAGISWSTALLRWLLLAGLAVGLGGAVADRFTASARAENATLPAVRPWLVPGTGVAAIGAAGLAVLLAAADGPGCCGGTVRDRSCWSSSPLVLALALATRRWYRSAGAVLLLVVAAEGVRSHAAGTTPGWGAVLTGVHLASCPGTQRSERPGVIIFIGVLRELVPVVLTGRHVATLR